MTYYGGSELAAAFRTVRDKTIELASEIPSGFYPFRTSSNTLSIGETLVYLAVSTGCQLHLHRAGITDVRQADMPKMFKTARECESQSRDKAQIILLLREEGEKVTSYLTSLPESFLAERVVMPPGVQPSTKTRFEMLLSTRDRELHHRGRLVVLRDLAAWRCAWSHSLL